MGPSARGRRPARAAATSTRPGRQWPCCRRRAARGAEPNHKNPGGQGARRGDREALGRSRGGLTTKIHLAADSRCRPLARVTSAGQRHDSLAFEPVMAALKIGRRGQGRPRTGRVLADKAYSSKVIRQSHRYARAPSRSSYAGSGRALTASERGHEMDVGGGLKIRGRGFRFGLTASAVVVAAGTAAVGIWPHAWPWLVVLTAVLAAGIPSGLSALTTMQQRQAETEKVARQGLQGTMGLVLPRVEVMTDLDARVHRAVLPIPYIRRDVADEARRCLEDGRPLLLVGSSMVGKTQMAVTLIRDMFANRRIAIPDSMGALAALDAADVTLQGSVIFLDDVDRLIGPGGITDGNLRRLASAGNVIIGTIRAAEYDRYQPTSQLRPPEWDILNVFKCYRSPEPLTA